MHFIKLKRETINKCLFIIYLQHGDQENLAPHIVRQVYKEFSSFKSEPVEGIQVSMNEDDVTEIHASLDGPRKFLNVIGHFLE